MSRAATELAERDLEADRGSARAARGSSEPLPGGRGGGGAGECVRPARAREGLFSSSLPTRLLTPGSGLRRVAALAGHPLGRPVLPALPPSSSALSLDLPLAGATAQGYCFRVRVTCGESLACLGTGWSPVPSLCCAHARETRL